MNTLSAAIVSDQIIDEIIQTQKDKSGVLLITMKEVQEKNEFRYLPTETLTSIAKKLNIEFKDVYKAASIYPQFNLEPQGKHSVIVCCGSSCKSKGSKALLTEIGPSIGKEIPEIEIESSYTTDDLQFTIKNIDCFGICTQNPVVEIDGIKYNNMNPHKLNKILSTIKRKS
jgi:NADH:ubiquinone oxidoreductase subunit E